MEINLGQLRPTTLASIYNDMAELLYEAKRQDNNQDNIDYYQTSMETIIEALETNCGIIEAIEYISKNI